MFHQHVSCKQLTNSINEQSLGILETDENIRPNHQSNPSIIMNQIEQISSMDYESNSKNSMISENISKDNVGELNIFIRRVGMEDHLNIVKLLQTFDQEKYKFIQFPEIQNNNTATDISKDSDNKSMKTSLSLAGLRIDERGGIYLNPLLDTHSAYFKCYVAEDSRIGELVGYILFFNTIMEKGSHTSSILNPSSSFSHHSSNSSSLQTGNHATNNGSNDDPVAVIEDLYIKPSYRGYGIATQLWKKVLKSSLDRGCYGCECSFLLNNEEGMRFWKQKLGSQKVDSFLHQNYKHHNIANNEMNNSIGTKPAHGELDDKEEIVIEISRDEMKAYQDESSQEGFQL